MTNYGNTLTIDFGEVGYWTSMHPFRLKLDAGPLTNLIGDSENAHRVYELFMIRRPGDVWRYVMVELLDVPPQVKSSYERARAKAKNPYKDVHPWPENCVPLQDFDSLFFYYGDDVGGPEDVCWIDHRHSTAMHAFADQLFAQARVAQARLDWTDPLLKHEIRAIKNGAHPYHYLDECTWREECARARPNAPLYTEAFYEKLRHLISEPEVTSVAY